MSPTNNLGPVNENDAASDVYNAGLSKADAEEADDKRLPTYGNTDLFIRSTPSLRKDKREWLDTPGAQAQSNEKDADAQSRVGGLCVFVVA